VSEPTPPFAPAVRMALIVGGGLGLVTVLLLVGILLMRGVI
jgi:hypothetical protein